MKRLGRTRNSVKTPIEISLELTSCTVVLSGKVSRCLGSATLLRSCALWWPVRGLFWLFLADARPPKLHHLHQAHHYTNIATTIMTAVIARTPLENLPGAMNRKRKADYDENDDGFKFTRRTSKRTAKAQPAQPAPDPEPSQLKPRRRSARLSSDKSQLDTRANATEAPAKSLPKRTKKPATTPAAKKKATTPAPEPESKPAPVQTPKNEIRVAKRRETKIMLPFADTPVITRNKEMRKASKDGHRRSSTGLRGRRASSLIDSGMSNGKWRVNCKRCYSSF